MYTKLIVRLLSKAILDSFGVLFLIANLCYWIKSMILPPQQLLFFWLVGVFFGIVIEIEHFQEIFNLVAEKSKT